MNDQTPPPAPAGYLARLVERVVPTEPTLRRRQPALFEGTHAALAEPALETVDASVAPRDTAPVFAESAASPKPMYTPTVPTQTPGLSPSRPPQDHAPSAAVTRTAAPHEAPRVDSTVRIVMAEAPARAVPAPSPAAFVPAATVRAPAPPPEHPALPGATRSHPAPASEREAAARPRRAPEPPAEAPMTHSRAVARITPVAIPTRPKPGAASPAPTATPPRMAPPPALSPRNAARRQAATAPQPAPKTPAHELPPIEVTIGCIEVRAVTGAPSAPRGTTTAVPRLSLDQYLRDRGGQR